MITVIARVMMQLKPYMCKDYKRVTNCIPMCTTRCTCMQGRTKELIMLMQIFINTTFIISTACRCHSLIEDTYNACSLVIVIKHF